MFILFNHLRGAGRHGHYEHVQHAVRRMKGLLMTGPRTAAAFIDKFRGVTTPAPLAALCDDPRSMR